jgi:hypothetical protein
MQYIPWGYFFDEKASGDGSRPMYLMYEAKPINAPID